MSAPQAVKGPTRVAMPHMSPDPHAPKRSWWVEAQTREAFHAAAARESLRMRMAKGFGQGMVVGYVAPRTGRRG